MKTFLMFVLAALLAATVLTGCGGNHDEHSGAADSASAAAQKEVYTCPMHPSVVSDRSGACPVCGMALVKKSAATAASSSELAMLRSVSLSAAQRVIANVATVPAERQSLNKQIGAVGVVDFSEPLQTTVSARFSGRIEKLAVNYTGEVVRKGQPLFELYSPDLVSTQKDLLLALGSGPDNPMAGAARERLRTHFGMTARQIAALEQSGNVSSTVVFESPISGTVIAKQVQQGQYVSEGMPLYQLADLSTVWIYLDVYESDVRYLTKNHPVRITTESYPNEVFRGKVTFIEPVVNKETRTVRVRTEFPNPNGKLKPGMYVTSQIHVPESNSLTIPTSAVMYTGKRNVVWVEMEDNRFEPRDVTLGTTSGDRVEVLTGLTGGEKIVSQGGFLLESESQLLHPAADPHAQHGGAVTSNPPPAAASDRPAQAKQKDSQAPMSGQPDNVSVTIDAGYSPAVIHAKRGTPVRITFNRNDDSECSREVVFKDLNIRKELKAFGKTTVTVRPERTGEFAFTCGMNMMQGTLIVHD